MENGREPSMLRLGDGYVRACSICGAGGIRPLTGTGFDCEACGAVHGLRRCTRCGQVNWFGPLREMESNAREYTCEECGWAAAKWRWRPVTLGSIDASPPDRLVEHYRCAGIPLVPSLADPDRRVLNGPVAKVEGVPGLNASVVEVVLEREVALIIAESDPGFRAVVPYSEVDGLVFVKPQNYPEVVAGTRVDPSYGALVWRTGRLAVTFLFGNPDVCNRLFAPAMKRIQEARS